MSCSLETWYKYLKIYGINRRAKRKKVKKYRKGVRATQPNQMWHMDITEIPYGDNRKAYLQLIIDNYSRAIISWRVSSVKNASISVDSLMAAFHFTKEKAQYLLCDRGGENKAHKVDKLLMGKGVTQLFAKADVLFSNSMVEAVFRQLKQKFLKYRRLPTLKAVYQELYRFVRMYNKVIPHTQLAGATPLELLRGEFSADSFKRDCQQFKLEQVSYRTSLYQNCHKCLAL